MRKLIVSLAFISMLVLVLAVPVRRACAARPIATMDMESHLGWPGPQLIIPDWVGTITIDGNEYGMTFFSMATGKAFEEDVGVVSFFHVVWRIYDYCSFDFKNQVLEYGETLLWGTGSGLICLKNSIYLVNGVVEEAFGHFAVWQGHTVHMSGEIIWYDFGAPHYAPGIFQIN